MSAIGNLCFSIRRVIHMDSLATLSLEEKNQLDRLADQLNLLLEKKDVAASSKASELTSEILRIADVKDFSRMSDLLLRSYVYLYEIGQSNLAIPVGKKIAAKAEIYRNIPVHRRILNAIGAQYCDIADFASAMAYLENAVVLARRLNDATVEAACLANVIAVLQEMGHYRQAISMAERVLKLEDNSHLANMLKLQCASNGLFAAHRIGDTAAAARFLAEGETYLSVKAEPLRRAFFERGRVLYLVDLGDSPKAREHLDETLIAIGAEGNARIKTLLMIAGSVCKWGEGKKEEARTSLEQLHTASKRSRLYHHFVLQALIKVYGDSLTPAQAASGLAYGRELVEFTTSVKKAKFYRQLANKRIESDARIGSSLTITSIDPFSVVKDWLNASDVLGPVGDGDNGERRILTKHEELTAIHEDMARLRVSSLRRDIQTDAVDTAENWAIAAEFFDDETGQHCYRVGHLASMLAQEIGMDDTFCVRVEHASRLHDIGKIAVNEVILLKPGPLDAAEMAAMRLHTEVGAQILSGSDDPTLKMAVEVARHHHEWWNGAGYPTKLSGKEIPLSARVCAFADVYDALTHARSYKKAWSHERALEEIFRLAGSQFDPSLIKPFCDVVERYRADLLAQAIPAFADMDSNALIVSRRRLMETIGGN